MLSVQAQFRPCRNPPDKHSLWTGRLQTRLAICVTEHQELLKTEVTGMNLEEGGRTMSVQLWPFCVTRSASSSKWRKLSCTSVLHCESSQSPLPSPQIIILHKFCFQVQFFWVYAFSFRFNFDTFLTVPFLLRSFRTRSLWSKTLSIESLASLIWSITSLHLCMFPWNRRHSITWLSWRWMALRGLFTWQRHSTDNKADYTIPWNSWPQLESVRPYG